MDIPIAVVNALFTSETDRRGKQHKTNIKALSEAEWELYKKIQDLIYVVNLFASRSR